MVGYLTPETLPTQIMCRVLFIPNSTEWLGNVIGAIQPLISAENWTPYGAVTPEEAAEAMSIMFDRLCLNEGVCRMVGELVLWAGASAPDATNLLLCDGTHYSDADYPDLWSAIGTTYGGTGSTDFAVPDLQGKVVMGESGSHSIGETGGSETVTLTTAEMPSHSHTDVGHTHTAELSTASLAEAPVISVPVALPGVGVTGSGSANLTNTGGDGAHDNLQPYLVLNYYIVAV